MSRGGCFESSGFLGWIICGALVIFFFSSRRRHTRCSRDWSSDVCSSDLNNVFRVDQNSSELYLAPPPGKLVDCANNVMIWLGSGPFPEPLPLTFNGRTCYTLMTGQAGLDYWNAAVARWRADHPSLLPDIAPPVVSMFSPGIVGSTTLAGALSPTAAAPGELGAGRGRIPLPGPSHRAGNPTPPPPPTNT